MPSHTLCCWQKKVLGIWSASKFSFAFHSIHAFWVKFFVPYWYLISRVFNFAFFAIVKNREIKDPRKKILAKFKHAKFNTDTKNSNCRKKWFIRNGNKIYKIFINKTKNFHHLMNVAANHWNNAFSRCNTFIFNFSFKYVFCCVPVI